MKRLDTKLLWLQEETKKKPLQVVGVPTRLNTADLCTKRFSRARRLVLFLQFLIGVVAMDEFTGNFEQVGMEEFNGYVQKKALASNMKHVRRTMVEGPTKIPTNFVRAVTLLMVQQGLSGNIIEENVADMVHVERDFGYFVNKYKWFLAMVGIMNHGWLQTTYGLQAD